MFLTVLFTHPKKKTIIANMGRLWFSLLAPGGSVTPETPILCGVGASFLSVITDDRKPSQNHAQ